MSETEIIGKLTTLQHGFKMTPVFVDYIFGRTNLVCGETYHVGSTCS